jgi:hypothetical protein
VNSEQHFQEIRHEDDNLNGSLVLVDAHVHIHDCFPLASFLDGAYDNFKNVARMEGKADGFFGVLMLTETSRADFFQRMASCASGDCSMDTGDWNFIKTAEESSLVAQRHSGEQLLIVAGRQIVTSENLEVLALGTAKSYSDGAPISEVIKKVLDDGALAAVPWGFGKWLGRRGSVVTQILDGEVQPGFFLGDNSGRPHHMARPKHFEQAARKNIAILPGSDPLPFASQYQRAGRYGFAVKGTLDKHTPAKNLKQLIKQQAHEIKLYGQLERPLSFIKNQIGMQLYKYKKKTGG